MAWQWVGVLLRPLRDCEIFCFVTLSISRYCRLYCFCSMAMIGFVSINSVIVQKSIVGQILDVEKTWRKLSEDTVIGGFSYLPLSNKIRQDT